MRKVFVLLSVVICLLFLPCCDNNESVNQGRVQRGDVNLNTTEEAEITEAKLIVNGKDITQDNYVRINHAAKYAELPLTAILKELGYDVELKYDQNTDSYAVIVSEETKFLDTQYEYYGFPPDSGDTDYVRCIMDNEIIIDSDAVSTVLYWSYFARIEIDYDTNTVSINSVDPYASEKYEAKLLVNGKKITEGNSVSILVYDGHTDAEIPLLAIAKVLGATIQWQNEKVVAVSYKGKMEIYDTTKSDFGVNGLDGATTIRRMENDELFFDLNSIQGILKNVYGVTVTIDKDNSTIYVDSIK